MIALELGLRLSDMTKASDIIDQLKELVDLHGDIEVRIAYGNATCFYEVESMAQYSPEYNCLFVDGIPEGLEF